MKGLPGQKGRVAYTGHKGQHKILPADAVFQWVERTWLMQTNATITA